MKAAVIGILGCALLLLAIAAFAPASLLDRRIAVATGGKVRLVDATGTVWNGRGALASEAGTWRAPIAWTVAWTALATGTLAVAFEPDVGMTLPRGTLDAASTGVSLHDVTIELPRARWPTPCPDARRSCSAAGSRLRRERSRGTASAAAARSTRTGATRDSSPRAPSRTWATSMPHSFRRTAVCAAA